MILPILVVVSAVISREIVAKALSNLAAGTKNKWDDAVILAIITAANMVASDSTKVEAAINGVEAVQQMYNALKANDPKKLEELKRPSLESFNMNFESTTGA